MNRNIVILISLFSIISQACTEKYIPEPNQVAFAEDIWYSNNYLGNGEEWIPIYQLGTTDSDRDHYIKFSIDQERTSAEEGVHYELIEGDSCLIPKNRYIGYIKIKILDGGLIQNPRIQLQLVGNKDILPKSGMDRCMVYL